ncbi:MAG: hypothetical protein U0Q18_09525 [Bryobacteraceae bacterium]
MRIKSYYCDSVQKAFLLAQDELGPDALLLNSRESPAEGRHLGKFEVVFATDAPPLPAEEVPSLPVVPSPPNLETAMADFQRWLTQDVGASVYEDSRRGSESGRVEQAVSTQTRVSNKPAAEPVLDERSRQAVADAVRVDATLGQESEGRQITALVGPPGAGKTTTLVKLAVHYGLALRKVPLFISLDTQRVAGSVRLQAYARILGIPFLALESVRALKQTLESHRENRTILIDTPGYAAAQLEDAAEMAHCIAEIPEINAHLVLPASMKTADMSRAADRYESFRPGRLIFTRLDETDSYGSMVCQAIRSRKPISFLTAGQNIPEDLEPATQDRIVQLISREQEQRVRPAA